MNDMASESVASQSKISLYLARAKPAVFSTYCIIAAFGTYFCMYGFRKPFTAATYEDAVWLGIGYKTILVSAQVAGYTLSKFIGIKVVSEMPAPRRAITILLLLGLAELALLLFAVTPVPWNFVWLFVNGLPLGMVFGLVLSFLEGRKVTEALSAGLCASFIVSSGFVKTIGRSLIQNYDIDPYWMPAATGAIFVLPSLIFIFLLSRIPPPSMEDEKLRIKRGPMLAKDRREFFRRHAVGLCGLLLIYVLLTIVRSLRDDFAVEIWQELGVGDMPSIYARSELLVMLGVVGINGLAILIKNNRLALLSSLSLLSVGFFIVLGSIAAGTSGNQGSQGVLSPLTFMVLLGLGMYIPYVAFHTTIFERMIAAFRETGTIGYLMYLADALGYLAYVCMMVFRNLASEETSFLQLLIRTSASVAIVSILLSIFLSIHFMRTTPTDHPTMAGDQGAQS